jgi:hypothetical protein
MLGGAAAHYVWMSLAWNAGILVLFTALSARLYARMGR